MEGESFMVNFEGDFGGWRWGGPDILDRRAQAKSKMRAMSV